MSHCVCPWWLGYLLITPLRRRLTDPISILEPYVRPGMTVFEPGPGMGFFTLDLARLVGPAGRVVAADLQPKMLDRLQRRAARAGLSDRIDVRLASTDSLGIADLKNGVDFVLAFAMVHEVPDQGRFFSEIQQCLRPAGRVLLSEPRGHVSDSAFAETLAIARAAGLHAREAPPIRRNHVVVLSKPSAT